MRRPSGPAIGLAGVAVAYVVAQLVLFDPGRPLAWDEAVYLSQVSRGVEPVFFDAHRARGIPLLLLPPATLGADVAAVRGYLAGISGVGLFAGFTPWVATVRRAAPLAAAVFALSWTTLLYGSEIYPNLFTAFAAVAAAGWFVRCLATPSRTTVTALTLAVALVALLRPSESVSLAAGLGLALAGSRRLPVAPVAAVAGGVAMGWVSWLVEARFRWGSILERLRTVALRESTAEDVDALRQYLALVDGPTAGPVDDPTVAAPVVALLVAIAVAASAGVTLAGASRAPARVALVAGIVLAIPYLVLVDHVAVRFLVPSHALVCIPVAVGFEALARQARRARQATGVAAVLLVGAWAGWQLGIANSHEAALATARASARDVGAVLHEAAEGRPCAFASEFAYPQIQVVSGCRGARLVLRQGGAGVRTDPDALVAEGVRFFFVTRRSASGEAVRSTWPGARVVAAADRWTIHEHHPGGADPAG